MIPATVPTIFSATVAIRSIVGDELGGDRDLGDPQPGHLGDVDREVAHPLEVGDHPQPGDEHPQVAGDRLLQGEQLEGRCSTRSRAASMAASSEITCSAISASAVSSAWWRAGTATCTSWVIATRSSTIESSWSK